MLRIGIRNQPEHSDSGPVTLVQHLRAVRGSPAAWWEEVTRCVAKLPGASSSAWTTR